MDVSLCCSKGDTCIQEQFFPRVHVSSVSHRGYFTSQAAYDGKLILKAHTKSDKSPRHPQIGAQRETRPMAAEQQANTAILHMKSAHNPRIELPNS